jgi:DNA replication protein DnaC
VVVGSAKRQRRSRAIDEHQYRTVDLTTLSGLVMFHGEASTTRPRRVSGLRGIATFPSVDNRGATGNLRELVTLLQTVEGLQLFRAAFQENMTYKVGRYAALQQTSEEDVMQQIELLKIKRRDLRSLAQVKGDSDNWSIFESLSEGYRVAKDSASIFEALKARAMQRLALVSIEGAVESLRDDLVGALNDLTNFSSQAHVVAKTVDVVSNFLKNPKLMRTKLMNFMLLGSAGTGKTTLASRIGDVFAKAGIFVGNRRIDAGRAELIAQYEGQTVAKTRNFLTRHLDDGVIFIDEAYAITPWQNGKPEGYGTEAVTAMVEFMTRYTGLYCIIVAGYERQMTRYFLATNEGLSRRFPNKFVLRHMDATSLVTVFKRALLSGQGIPVPLGSGVALRSDDYFDAKAWRWLKKVIELCTDGIYQTADEYDGATCRTYPQVRHFVPAWPRLYTLFETQAGAMVNLADEALSVLMTTIRYEDVIAVLDAAVGITTQSVDVLRTVIVQRILHTTLSESDLYLDEFTRLELVMRCTGRGASA